MNYCYINSRYLKTHILSDCSIPSTTDTTVNIHKTNNNISNCDDVLTHSNLKI